MELRNINPKNYRNLSQSRHRSNLYFPKRLAKLQTNTKINSWKG